MYNSLPMYVYPPVNYRALFKLYKGLAVKKSDDDSRTVLALFSLEPAPERQSIDKKFLRLRSKKRKMFIVIF